MRKEKKKRFDFLLMQQFRKRSSAQIGKLCIFCSLVKTWLPLYVFMFCVVSNYYYYFSFTTPFHSLKVFIYLLYSFLLSHSYMQFHYHNIHIPTYLLSVQNKMKLEKNSLWFYAKEFQFWAFFLEGTLIYISIYIIFSPLENRIKEQQTFVKRIFFSRPILSFFFILNIDCKQSFM